MPRSAEDLSFVGCTAAGEVFAEDAGMLRGCCRRGLQGSAGPLHRRPRCSRAAALLDRVAVAVRLDMSRSSPRAMGHRER